LRPKACGNTWRCGLQQSKRSSQAAPRPLLLEPENVSGLAELCLCISIVRNERVRALLTPMLVQATIMAIAIIRVPQILNQKNPQMTGLLALELGLTFPACTCSHLLLPV
jgi:hypothetical protein